MTKNFIYLLLCWTLLPSSLAKAKATSAPKETFLEYTHELGQFRNRIWSIRIKQVLGHRLTGLRTCRSSGKLSAEQVHLISASIEEVFRLNTLSNSTMDTDSTQTSENLLLAMQETEGWNSKELCQDQIKAAEKKLKASETEQFSWIEKQVTAVCVARSALLPFGSGIFSIPKCRATLKLLIKELEPECSSVVFPYFRTTYVDSNPCYGGARILKESFLKSTKLGLGTPLAETMAFLIELDRRIYQATPGSTIDLWSVFAREREFSNLSVSPASSQASSQANARYFFMGMIAYLEGMAGNSSAGYIAPFIDHVWRDGIKSNKPIAKIVENYNGLLMKSDLQRDLNINIRNKKLTLKVGDHDVTHASRHDFTASLLSCHFSRTGRPELATAVPILMGYGYETLDFVSHLKDGVTVKRALENFKTDTNRYIQGALWGQAFCAN